MPDSDNLRLRCSYNTVTPMSFMADTCWKRSNREIRVTPLWSRKSPEGREIGTGLWHPTTGELSLNQPSSNWVPFANSGMIRQ